MAGHTRSAAAAVLLLACLSCVPPWFATAQAPPPPADVSTPSITATDYKQLALGVVQVCEGTDADSCASHWEGAHQAACLATLSAAG